jgi:hypothetical protein
MRLGSRAVRKIGQLLFFGEISTADSCRTEAVPDAMEEALQLRTGSPMRKRAAQKCLEFALGVALFFVSGFASAQNLLANPSFETLGQASWTAVIAGPAAWVDSGATPPVTDGVNGIFSTQGAPSSQILYQDVVLPATGAYRVRLDVGCDPAGGATTDFCRVDITNTNAATIVPPVPALDTLATTGANVLQAVYSRDGPAGIDPQGTVTATFNGTAGQTVRLRLLVQASNDPATILVDNMSLVAATAVPTLSQWGMIILSLILALGAFVMMRRERG